MGEKPRGLIAAGAFDRIDPKSMPVCDFALHYGVVVEERKRRTIVNVRYYS
jgi:hypothetical protein